MSVEVPETVRLPQRHRTTQHAAVQTEASFVPSCVDLKYKYEPLASEQYRQLYELRRMTQQCLQEVAKSVYDVVAFKDVLFRLEDALPSQFPVTDMLLLSSRLFRRTSELARLLSCFFAVAFADEHADEHFHFTEVRLVQRELSEVKRRLRTCEEEKAALQQMLASFGQMAHDHGRAVDVLESQNRALQLQTTALEDQMALLFHQVNADLQSSCKEAYERVSLEMALHERLNPTRTMFKQTMDSISQQIRTSRGLIADVRETLLTCTSSSSGGRNIGSAGGGGEGGGGGGGNSSYAAVEPSVRYKLKTLDSNFQQLVSRFNSVKDTVVETAHEHMTALHERKKILYLAFQHIRLYDLQNAKLRHGRAVLSELRAHTADLLQRVQATFPTGAITSVDRIGRITSQRWQGGYTLAALRQSKQQQQQQQQQRRSGSVQPASSSAAAAGSLGMSEAEVMAVQSELAALGEQTALPMTPASLSNSTQPSKLTLPMLPLHAMATAAGNNNSNNSNAAVQQQQQQQQYMMSARAPNASGGGDLVGGGGGSGDATATRASSPAGRDLSALSLNNNNNNSSSGSSSPQRYVLPSGGVQPPTGLVATAAAVEEAMASRVPAYPTVHALYDVLRTMDSDMRELNDALTLEDEMAAFLRALTLSVSTTPRSDVRAGDGTMLLSSSTWQQQQQRGGLGDTTAVPFESVYEAALQPTGGQPPPADEDDSGDVFASAAARAAGGRGGGGGDELDMPSVSFVSGLTGERGRGRDGGGYIDDDDDDGDDEGGGGAGQKQRGRTSTPSSPTRAGGGGALSRHERMQSDAMLARQAAQIQRHQEQLAKMQEDFAAKIGFLRQVYEARIADLEAKESALRQRFARTSPPSASPAAMSLTFADAHDNNNGGGGRGAGRPASSSASPPSLAQPRQRAMSVSTSAARRDEQGNGVGNSGNVRGGSPGRRLDKDSSSSGVEQQSPQQQQQQQRSDREELLQARASWGKAQSSVQSQRPLREATVAEVGRLRAKTQQKLERKAAAAAAAAAAASSMSGMSSGMGSGGGGGGDGLL